MLAELKRALAGIVHTVDLVYRHDIALRIAYIPGEVVGGGTPVGYAGAVAGGVVVVMVEAAGGVLKPLLGDFFYFAVYVPLDVIGAVGDAAF